MTRLREQRYGPDGDYQVHFSDIDALDGEHCHSCLDLVIEAWERMAFGGVNGQEVHGFGYVFNSARPSLYPSPETDYSRLWSVYVAR